MVSRRAEDLELLRSTLLSALGAVEPKDRPRISKELRAVDAELEALAPSVSPGQAYVDQLKERRAQRHSAP